MQSRGITTRLLRDGSWNLAGVLLPVPVAVIAVPYLLRALGDARFGLLTLAWAVMAYFTLFNLGLGRASTHEIAALPAHGSRDRLRRIVWTSLAGHAGLGVIGCALLVALAGPLAAAFNLEPSLEAEFRTALMLLALSVPVLLLTTALGAVLEGFGRFDLVNVVRLPASLWTYAAPLAIVTWSAGLPAVIGTIVLGRALALLAYVAAVSRVAADVWPPVAPSRDVLRPMVALGFWVTVGTIVLPLVTAWDRFALGVRVSAEAVGHYAAPYEVVTKLWTISGALMGAAFPAFTAVWSTNRPEAGLVLRHAAAALYMAAVPAGVVIVATAPLLLPWWLGEAFAGEAVPVAQWLTIGVVASVIAQAGFTFLQATGRAGWVGRLQLSEVLVYSVGAWLAAGTWGAAGVAVVWSARAFVDCVALLVAANRQVRSVGVPAFTRAQWLGLLLVPAGAFAAVLGAETAEAGVVLRSVLACVAGGGALAWGWWGLIDRQTRAGWLLRLQRTP